MSKVADIRFPGQMKRDFGDVGRMVADPLHIGNHFKRRGDLTKIAGNRLLDMLPPELRASYEHLVLEDEEDVLPFVKAADKLSAHIKCLEEQKTGNTEFDSAARQTWEAMKAMDRPELNWFLEHCLPAFCLNLDQL